MSTRTKNPHAVAMAKRRAQKLGKLRVIESAKKAGQARMTNAKRGANGRVLPTAAQVNMNANDDKGGKK